MADFRYTLTWEDREAQALFARLIAGATNMRPLMAAIGGILEDSTRERFNTGEGPDGIPWDALKPATLKRKGGRGRILVERGDLLGSIVAEVFDDAVEIHAGPNAYAAAHQFGFEEGGIPARPYLGISDTDAQAIIDEASAYLEYLVEGR